METRFVEVDEFIVKGLTLKGSFAEIPRLWERLNAQLAKKGITAEESFGVILSVRDGELHYIAGVKSELVEILADAEEVVISAGKFIAAKVEGGIPAIATTFDAIHNMTDLQLRSGYGMERYIRSSGSEGYEIEVWMPVE